MRVIRSWRGALTSRHPLHHYTNLSLSSWRPFSSSSSSSYINRFPFPPTEKDSPENVKPIRNDNISNKSTILNNLKDVISSSPRLNPTSPSPTITSTVDQSQNENRPYRWSSIDPGILPYLRRCDTTSDIDEVDELDRLSQDIFTGFHILFLGTGSGASYNRMPSCTVLRLSHEVFIFDAGEGAQITLKDSRAKLKRVTRIFITHMHGDHILGLPGLLLSSSVANLFEPDSTLKVYGPPGLYNFLTTTLVLCHCKLKTTVEVYELMGGSLVRQQPQHPKGALFPQFRHPNIIRKTIPCGEDGVWTIKAFDSVMSSKDPRYLEDYEIKASELHHVPNVQTVGYVVKEQEPQKRIDVWKCEKLGLMPSMKFSELKNGVAVQNDDGTREIQPHEVLIDNPHKARKVAVLGDTCGVPFAMAQLCKDADVLIHEATLREEYLNVSGSGDLLVFLLDMLCLLSRNFNFNSTF